LIIVKQVNLESLLVAICKQYAPDIIGNEYFVFGTMDRKNWEDAQTEKLSQLEAIDRVYPFKNIWQFDVGSARWYREK